MDIKTPLAFIAMTLVGGCTDLKAVPTEQPTETAIPAQALEQCVAQPWLEWCPYAAK